MKDVLLASTLHDPRGVFLDALTKVPEVVLAEYTGWLINVTTTTDQRIKNALGSLNPLGVIMTETDPDNPIVPDKIENDHLYLLKQTVGVARKLRVDKIQYTDGDRIITAATYYPGDLQQMALKASTLLGDNGSYINFRRRPEDYFTHHPPLVVTEFGSNRLYSAAFGILIDTGSTAHGMSLDVVEEILRRSPQMESVSFPNPKWLLIAKESGAAIRSEETQRVLTFETPDQFKDEARERVLEASIRLGLPELPTNSPYEKVQQDYRITLGLDSIRSLDEWSLRFNTERQYLTLLRNHLAIFGYTEEQEDRLFREINRSLAFMERQYSAITEALKNPSSFE